MNEMVNVLQMNDKINAKAKKLSGGQRRKLSVGIALIAGSKVDLHNHNSPIKIVVFTSTTILYHYSLLHSKYFVKLKCIVHHAL